MKEVHETEVEKQKFGKKKKKDRRWFVLTEKNDYV